ncbi:hypothetical protein DSO57_1006595 [Entomophthora muscae]|uniref:Uncharacterized protein n=1 Tax=Entomophthora muscae TaxID=34485 RepID=A0ACC2SKK0_9FUNG|nr:hypothetical protein DSO57_1006595 [Entomophthora muscae]
MICMVMIGRGAKLPKIVLSHIAVHAGLPCDFKATEKIVTVKPGPTQMVMILALVPKLNWGTG